MTLKEALQQRDTFTENGAITNSTSLSKCLDYFFVAGTVKDHTQDFIEAFKEDPNIALKILFWSRDIRKGAGIKNTFQIVMKEMQDSCPSLFLKLCKEIPEMGYWKDIFKLKPSPTLVEWVYNTINENGDHSLCAKYCPRKGWWFSELLKYINSNKKTWTQKELRQWLVKKSTTVEQQICSGQWSDIKYENVPSVAGSRYRKVFYKHDEERYSVYCHKASQGETKINSFILFPHEICQEFMYSSDPNLDLIRAQWKGLPDLMKDNTKRILPLCDVSGSMTGIPLLISIAMGCYISERNDGSFKDMFMTFENKPQLQLLSGDIIDRFKQMKSAKWGGNTDLQAAFDMILTHALENNVPQSEMPSCLLIISDMEFDSACIREFDYNTFTYSSKNKLTNLDAIKKKYAESGYELPEIIFWNVRGKSGNVPSSMSDEKIGLVSGYSPNILTSILKGDVVNPYQLLLDTVSTERYQNIHI